jgi:hypothetical protein
MPLGGNNLCQGCLTYSAASTGGLCSACMLRESNERLAQNQIRQMQEMHSQTQSSAGHQIVVNYPYSKSEILTLLFFIWIMIGTVVWIFSYDMTWWESLFYIFSFHTDIRWPFF